MTLSYAGAGIFTVFIILLILLYAACNSIVVALKILLPFVYLVIPVIIVLFQMLNENFKKLKMEDNIIFVIANTVVAFFCITPIMLVISDGFIQLAECGIIEGLMGIVSIVIVTAILAMVYGFILFMYYLIVIEGFLHDYTKTKSRKSLLLSLIISVIVVICVCEIIWLIIYNLLHCGYHETIVPKIISISVVNIYKFLTNLILSFF